MYILWRQRQCREARKIFLNYLSKHIFTLVPLFVSIFAEIPLTLDSIFTWTYVKRDVSWNVGHVLKEQLKSHLRAGRHKCRHITDIHHVHFLSSLISLVLPTLPSPSAVSRDAWKMVRGNNVCISFPSSITPLKIISFAIFNSTAMPSIIPLYVSERVPLPVIKCPLCQTKQSVLRKTARVVQRLDPHFATVLHFVFKLKCFVFSTLIVGQGFVTAQLEQASWVSMYRFRCYVQKVVAVMGAWNFPIWFLPWRNSSKLDMFSYVAPKLQNWSTCHNCLHRWEWTLNTVN